MCFNHHRVPLWSFFGLWMTHSGTVETPVEKSLAAMEMPISHPIDYRNCSFEESKWQFRTLLHRLKFSLSSRYCSHLASRNSCSSSSRSGCFMEIGFVGSLTIWCCGSCSKTRSTSSADSEIHHTGFLISLDDGKKLKS